tara:strand:+ start:2481 stop:3143 length:663 start_codon:yes stop_codon:yes gene_type:complete
MMRFEKKYKFNPFEDIALINYLKCNDFNEIYTSRKVQSLYYDTNDLDLYHDSVLGIQDRKKIRIRFYNSCNKKFNIEYKIKNSDLGYKKIPNLNSIKHGELIPIIFSKNNSKENIIALPIHLENVYFPKIFIEYKRRYFYSKKFNIRVTIDKRLKFSRAKIYREKIKLFQTKPVTHNVLEIKYDQNNILENELDFNISNNSNLILERSSKYCDAVETVYF